jgi:NADH-quinone oxidoreductase subunit N
MGDFLMGVLPVAGMALAACLLFLLSAVVRGPRLMGGLGVAAILLLGGAPVLFLWSEGGRVVPQTLLSADRLALFFDGLFVLAAALVALLSLDYFRRKESEHGELVGFLALAAMGMMVLGSATNLVTFYLGLETMSISFYVLAAFLRTHENSVEASLKYFLLGAFSSAFLLFGMALIYGSAGSLDFGGVAAVLASGSPALGEPFLLFGFFLFLVGLFFKLSLIPFHFWAPDVYQGAPTPVTALMAVGGKTAAAAGAIRIYLSAFQTSPALSEKWLLLFATVGLLTVFVGSMIAITQRQMKRLLAYSSIVHAGFIALGLGTLAVPALRGPMLEAVLFYLAAYLLMNVGAFTVAGAVETQGRTDESLTAYAGLGTSAPFAGALFAVFMFSLAGIPLTVGFLGKFYVFKVLVNGGFYWYAALGLVGAVIATYYYLKVVVTLYFPGPDAEIPPAPTMGPVTLGVLALMGAGTLYLGIFPGLLNALVSGLTIG